MKNNIGFAFAAAACMAASLCAAADAVLEWRFADGRVAKETVRLAEEGEVTSLSLKREDIVGKGAVSLKVTPDFAHARKGEAGYWFSPYGYYGEFDRDSGSFFSAEERMNMPMYGWSTPRGAFLAIITSLKYYPKHRVDVKDGAYAISCVLEEQLCRRPYEDFRIEFHRFPAGTGYAALAKRYREYQLGRGAVKPLRERVKDNPILEYAVAAPEIRIRQAWKPVPSPVPHQTPESEPPVKVVVTFDRVREISAALKKAGVGKAELCLVGWNIGGHDGRWPQVFPSESLLGGDAKLRSTIEAVKSDGYFIVPHGNFRDGYIIADCWDAEWTVKNEDGSLHPDRDGKYRWGGGMPYVICPQRAYERFCTRDMPRIAALGFKGLGYFDVVSILHATECLDRRHPCSGADGARYWGMCADISRREFGGFASEGSVDHFAGSLDSVLYASFSSPTDIEAAARSGKGLAKTHVPIFQIVYNGIIVQNPFASTVNFTMQDRYWQLKLLEYGGRPNFYFYSKFVSDGTDWMGKRDLACATEEELAVSVAKIKEGWDVYAGLSHLQYEFMENHERLADGVFRTTWSNGESLVVNYNDAPFAVSGAEVAPMGWKLFGK